VFFFKSQTATYTVRLKVEGCRIKMQGMIKIEEWQVQTWKKWRHLCPEGFEAAEGFSQFQLNPSGNHK
jgi:hypothetical protein